MSTYTHACVNYLYLNECRTSNESAHKKYGDPGETDVIEWNCSLEWIVALALALGVVVVPINAGVIIDERDITIWHSRIVAHQVSWMRETPIRSIIWSSIW